MGRRYLTDFELMILLAILRVGDDAYGVPIAREIEDTGKRTVLLGAVWCRVYGARSNGSGGPGVVEDGRTDCGARRQGEALLRRNGKRCTRREGDAASADCPVDWSSGLERRIRMNSANRPPRTPGLLLQWFLPHNTALAGDLEEDHRRRESAVWYWRQVLAAIVLHLWSEVRAHKLLAIRAVVTGWAALWVLSLLEAEINRFMSGWVLDRLILIFWTHPFPMMWATQLWNRPATALSFVLSGWVVGCCRPTASKSSAGNGSPVHRHDPRLDRVSGRRQVDQSAQHPRAISVA